MKKIALLFLLQFLALQTWSQLSLSPVAAANISKVRFTEGPFESVFAMRYAVGAQFAYQISEKLSAGLGLQYSTKGYSENTEQNTLLPDARYQYIELVPFAEYRPIQQFGIVAGGGVGFLSNESYRESDKWVEPNFDLAEKKDIYLLLGARYYFGKAFLSISFSHSVSSVLDYRLSDISSIDKSGKAYSQVVSIGLGYKFHIVNK